MEFVSLSNRYGESLHVSAPTAGGYAVIRLAWYTDGISGRLFWIPLVGVIELGLRTRWARLVTSPDSCSGDGIDRRGKERAPVRAGRRSVPVAIVITIPLCSRHQFTLGCEERQSAQ